MKTRRNNIILILNILIIVIFLLPVFKLDLYSQNYSTLSLNTEGYLFDLIIGLLIGLLLGHETYHIKNKYCAITIFISMLLGVLIPHHIPYNLQGNLHLLFAYIGFCGIVSITLINCSLNIKLRNYYILTIFLAICFYLKCGMVNTISEVIVMLSTLITNLYLYRHLKQHD